MRKTLYCLFAAMAGASLYAGELKNDISPQTNSMSIKGENVDVSVMSELVAVIPPWRGERFNKKQPIEVIREGNKVLSRQTGGNSIDEFELKEFSCTTSGNTAVINIDAVLKQDLPTNMFFQALMIPDYLLAGAEYEAVMADGKTVKSKISEKLEKAGEVIDLCKEFKSITFTSYYGKLTVKSVEGPALTLIDRRANSPYNPICGFEIGARWPATVDAPVKCTIEVVFDEREFERITPVAPVENAQLETIQVRNLFVPPKADYSKVPAPREVKPLPGASFVCGPAINVVLNGLDAKSADFDRLSRAAERILGGKFEQIDITASTPAGRNPVINVEIGKDNNLPEAEDAYSITVNNAEITIKSHTARGAFYALHTLRMMADDGIIEPVEVVDYPDYEYRGIHLLLDKDSVEVSGAMIENLFAPLKINNLVVECQYVKWDATKPLHQQWAMNKEQVAELRKIAEDNFMEFTPLFQTLGHCEWLFANGQNVELSENPDHLFAYNPYHPDVYPLMDSVLEEIIDVFNPTYLHIGHDEVFNAATEWPFQPENKERGAKKVFFDDVMHYYDFAKKNNLKMMMWHDMLVTEEECPENGVGGPPRNLAEIRKDLPKDIYIVFWRYSSGFPFTDIDKVYSEGFHNIIGATWYDLANIVNMAQYGKGKLHGMLSTTWTGYNGNAVAVRKHFMQIHPYAQLAVSTWNSDLPLGAVNSAELYCDLMEPTRKLTPASGRVINLAPFANVIIDPAKNVFMSDTTYGLESLPTPVLTAGGMEFRIAERNGWPAAITVKSRTAPEFPAEVAIPFNLKAEKLHFLHTTINGMLKPDTPVGSYIITYSDGEKAEAPIIYGRNINALNGEINFDVAPLRAYEWENDGNIFRMWYLTWENPHPEKEIATIELKGNESNLPIYWFGLSMEE